MSSEPASSSTAAPSGIGDLAQPDEAALRMALQDVLDPEIGESIVDLGLVHTVEITPGVVRVTLIPTSATCPMGEMLVEEATDALERACPEGTFVEVVIDWEITWEPDRMKPSLKSHFGW